MTNTIKEARIVLPHLPCTEDGDAVQDALDALMHAFGGHTAIAGSGTWRDAAGKVHVDDVIVVDVAMAQTSENAMSLWRIAERFREAAKQQSVYVRYSSGRVTFVDGSYKSARTAAYGKEENVA